MCRSAHHVFGPFLCQHFVVPELATALRSDLAPVGAARLRHELWGGSVHA